MILMASDASDTFALQHREPSLQCIDCALAEARCLRLLNCDGLALQYSLFSRSHIQTLRASKASGEL